MRRARAVGIGIAGATAVLAVAVHAEPVDVPRERARNDAVLAEGAADVCGRHVHAHFDWRAYDGLDWKTAGRDKGEQILAVRSSLDYVHDGLTLVCSDPAMKAALAAIDTIVYVPTDDSSLKLAAAFSGSTLTFTDYIFGSTRDARDFEGVLRRARPPDAPAKPAAPVSLGTPSGKWDATYRDESSTTYNGDQCFYSGGAAPLTVAHGKFSFGWQIANFLDDAPVLELGRVSGVVHADGTAIATVAWTSPKLQAKDPRMVRVARNLATVTDFPLEFKRTPDGLSIRSAFGVPGGDRDQLCEYRYDWTDPKLEKARHAAAERAEANKTPAQHARERKDAQAKQAADNQATDKANADRKARSEAQSRCTAGCDESAHTCTARCRETTTSCKDSCRGLSDLDKRDYECPSHCTDTENSCRSSCDQDRESCHDRCATQ